MPFAGFKDFAACVAANSDKSDPAAYCATIQHATEKADRAFAPNERFVFKVVKSDDERQLVFGWASMAKRRDGSYVLDSQDDMIHPSDLEDAAYGYMLRFGDVNKMHDGGGVGRVVESFVVTADKLEKMGLAADALPMGWWLGTWVHDDATYQEVRTGKLRMFSIEGTGERS